MKRHDAVDPKIDRLIAALYGEMSDAERRDFDAELAADPALRAEWEEISGTRSLLAGWELEERVPSSPHEHSGLLRATSRHRNSVRHDG